MAQNWEDLGNGQWKLTITDDTGRVPPAIVRGTKDEILEKLADSKINGDRRINELRSSQPAISAGERLQIVADLQNPANVEKAIGKVVETMIGPVEELREDRRAERLERQTRQAVTAAQTFADTTAGWYPSEHNKRVLTEYMQRMGMSHSNVADYRTAFNDLTAAGLLQALPGQPGEGEDETETQPRATQAERTAPAPVRQPQAPTRFSTGVRSSDVSGTQPKPSNRLKYTREQIDRMGAKRYKELMSSDPEFAKCVEAYSGRRRAS